MHHPGSIDKPTTENMNAVRTVCCLCGAASTTQIIPSTLHQVKHGSWSAYACTSSGYGRHGPIVRCDSCGMVFADPRPKSDEVLSIYEAVKDPLYVEERAGRVLTFEHHLRPMEKLTGKANGRRLLDVGAYTGVFVDIATRHGWDAWGMEPSRWAVEHGREQGLQMVNGTLESSTLPDASFDVVTMWDVIEHVANPLETVRAAWRVLRPGGYLVVHTMDLASPFAKVMGTRWPWFMEMHLFYFTRDTMRLMLERAQFDILWMGAQGRYLQAGYLASRVTALAPFPGRILEWWMTVLRLRKTPLRINLGDLFTTYARKPLENTTDS
ncbi:MAG: class I SAM-dependent methyltransferase [Anaerolineae bacterium]|nr:class I SAM-dependent methyltransferase [Anaerolineae bacterium]